MMSSKLATFTFLAMVALGYCDMMRKSIVFDKATPDVFYCPVDKPYSFEKMFVRSKPLSKLCEFNGKGLPEDYKSDCYADVDETEYACKEKKRIMKRSQDETKVSDAVSTGVHMINTEKKRNSL